ncbi:hypothetical protein GCM10027271_13050 [Saccharopolyspora gloriosae]|uniref:Uncharacterized protein n=1 Tax=Saccharopolyspora gloriosae TaxID=455344 RepID=A0A840NMR2_9PSEU|nr:hypothetical protein [Saccharopolyspora gloriosae]MBB5072844.1 hypothetical protein [Saccharopolyspora gloriosae]
MASDNKLPAEVEGEETRMPRPLRRLPSLPDPELIRSLRAAAKKKLGMGDRAAGAMSTLFVHPDQILPQLENTRRMRIPGGDLLYIEGLVWTPRLMADFNNPRNAADYTYPVAGRTVEEGDNIFNTAVEAQAAELTLTVPGRDQLAIALNRAMEKTRAKNKPYPKIGEQGIMDAPFGVMSVIKFDDGSADLAVPHVREGSTRVSWAQQELECMPEDTLFRTPSSAKPMKDFLDEINAIVEQPAKEITSANRARVRCATTNFILIVGFEPDEPGSVDLEEAIKVKVAQEHLNVKVDWAENAQNAVLADDCLKAAFRGRLLHNENEYSWLAGGIFHKEAVDRGLAEYLDDRFARLLWLFTTKDPAVHDVIRQPIAFVLRREKKGRVQVRQTTKLPFAIELAAREFRGTLRYPDTAMERIIKVMTNGGPIAMKAPWRSTGRSLSALVKAAQHEVEGGEIGAASTELAVRALYYVAVHDVLRVPRNDLGSRSDRRKVADVLEAMTRTPAGIRQLENIIKDGRDGSCPVLRDASGEPVRNGEGKPVSLTDKQLRYELFPRDGRGQTDDTSDPFMEAQRVVSKALHALQDGLMDLEAVLDEEGVSVIQQQGLPRVTAKKWREIISEAGKKLEDWFTIGVEYGASVTDPPPVLIEETVSEDSDESGVERR